MKSGVKGFIIFVSGAAAGGSVAAFFVHRWAKKTYLAAADDKVKSLEEYIDRIRNEELASDLGYKEESEVSDGDAGESCGSGNGSVSGGKSDNYISDGKKDAARKVMDHAKKVNLEPDYRDYTQYSKGSEGKSIDPADYTHPVDSDESGYEEFDEDEYEQARQDALSRSWSEKINSGSKPKIIPFEEYGSTGYLDEVTLYFYQEDGILATEDNEILTDIEAILGDALTKFGFDKNDEKVIYVRNYSRSTDYEVSKVFEGFPGNEPY